MVCLVIASVLKVLHHINCLGDLNFVELEVKHGMWFNVHDDSIRQWLEIVDKIWLTLALVCPMIQSLYLTIKGHDSHGIIITICDNRKANKGNFMNENKDDNNEESELYQEGYRNQ